MAGPSAPTRRSEAGLPITVDSGGDFLGYEESFYTVSPGLRIIFSRAESVIEGVRTPQPHPRVAIFRLSRRARHVRLLYLLRSSQADHNMAILAAPDAETLERLTAAIRANPATACQAPRCTWVPAGIAVRPLNM